MDRSRHAVAPSTPRRSTPFAFLACVVALCLISATAAQAAPTLVGAVSRKTHAGQDFDIPLIKPNTTPVTSLNAIEPRIVLTLGTKIVLKFDVPVNAGTATVARTAGKTTALVPAVGTITFSNNTMIIPLSNLDDNQLYTISAKNVAATDGSGTLATVPDVTIRTLSGDVTGDGFVKTGDVSAVKFYASGALNNATFRCDLNCNGSITTGDVSAVKTTAGVTSGGIIGTGAVVNTTPTIGAIADMTVTNDAASAPIGFAVNDAETDPNNLDVSAVSSNATLLPNAPANIILGGTGTSRTISLLPAANQTGACTVTVTVSDGLANASVVFNVTVTNGTVLYVASLTPESGANSTGAGTATLQVSADQSYALLRFSYNNLSSPKNAEHIHLGASNVAGPILYDIDTPQPPSPAKPLADGSYKWVFAQSGNFTIQDQRNAIASGNTYINIHTGNYPNGEIRGQFLLVQGSQTFTPPPAPPALPNAPATQADAVRFLQQSTFGATMADVVALTPASVGGTNTATSAIAAFNKWIDDQVAVPQTNTLNIVKARYVQNEDGAGNGASVSFSPTGINTIWGTFLTGPDQLRQRVAYALSQIFVISDVDDALESHSTGFPSYHDKLAADAFGNFRTLLADVTLHPMMGQYLSMRGNSGPSTVSSTVTPNENYAREILQLFSIGLNWLQPDGTLKLDANGLPIPTYGQPTITAFSHVFTGWNANTNTVISTMAASVTTTFNESWIAPMTISSDSTAKSLHSIRQKDLLSHDPNDPTAFTSIPATAANSQTVAIATGELNTALDNVFNHPNVGPFIARRLIQRLVCSNPSPAYVYRVAQVFDHSGPNNTRGDLLAVVRAILTDYEARSTAFLPDWSTASYTTGVPGYGKVREPVLRMSQIIRAFHPQSKTPVAQTGRFRISTTDTNMYQTPYRAPTVFNFYEPDFADAGIIASANLVSPEMQIETESTTIDQHNTIYSGIFNSNAATPSYGWPGGDVLIDLTAGDASCPAALGGSASEATLCDTAAGVDTCLARMNLLLMANQMPAQNVVISGTTYNMKNQIAAQIKAMNAGGSAANDLARARSMLRLIVSSPQFTTQR